jgi:hypothetical protein
LSFTQQEYGLGDFFSKTSSGHIGSDGVSTFVAVESHSEKQLQLEKTCLANTTYEEDQNMTVKVFK